MMYTANGILDLRPKAFDAVCVGIATYKHAFAVRYAQVIESALCKPVVHRIFIGVDRRIKRNSIVNEGYHGAGLRVWHDFGLHFPCALNSTHNRGFTSRTTSTLTLANAADIGFVNFNIAAIATLSIAALIQATTNHFKHAPCSLVGYAKFAFKLFGRNARAGLRHQVDSIEPLSKRSRGMVKNRTSGRRHLMTAPLATKRFAAGDVMILGTNNTAFLTSYSIGVAAIKQPSKARLIIGVLALHILKREFYHWRFSLFTRSVCHDDYLLCLPNCHQYIINCT